MNDPHSFKTKSKFLRVAFKALHKLTPNQHSGLIAISHFHILYPKTLTLTLLNWPPKLTSHIFPLKSYPPFKVELIVTPPSKLPLFPQLEELFLFQTLLAQFCTL